jgi:nucleoside-diphosphate-sugar epimerase
MELSTQYQKIVITGASGWLGHRIVLAIMQGNPEMGLVKNSGIKLRCLVPVGENAQNLLSLGCEVIYGDVRDPKAANDLFNGMEGALVLHIAGLIHPPGKTRYFEEVNVNGTQNLLDAASRFNVKRFVAMSSNSPLGTNPDSEHQFTEDSPYHPYMGYGKSKWKMELLLKRAMNESHRPEIVIVRAPWFYGPGQPPRQTQFFSMIKQGKFPLMGKGLNKRSMAYVDSLAYGILLAAVHEKAVNEIFWIADERPYSMLEIVTTVREVMTEDFGMQVSKKIMHVPSLISDCAYLADLMLQKAGLYHQKIHVLSELNKTIACDISKAKAILGYTPLVDLREGMKRSIQWCQENGQTI